MYAAGPAVFLALLAPMARGRDERAVAGLAFLFALVCLPLGRLASRSSSRLWPPRWVLAVTR